MQVKSLIKAGSRKKEVVIERGARGERGKKKNRGKRVEEEGLSAVSPLC